MDKYSYNVMGSIRQAMGLQPYDESRDDEIMAMGKEKAFSRYCRSMGVDLKTAKQLINAAKEIYDMHAAVAHAGNAEN